MKIINYNNCDDIIVEFQDKYKEKVHTKYCHFKKGTVLNPKSQNFSYNLNNAKSFWSNMLKRCENKFKNKNYDSYCCKEWEDFSNFEKWFNENYYEVEGERMALDKDILVKGNKVYSPETCVFVPQRINTLFAIRIKSNVKKSTLELPIGVTETKYGKYRAEAKKHYLGIFESPEEAFGAYKTYKESYIKQIADEYKLKIPKKLYDAMYKWKVEITD